MKKKYLLFIITLLILLVYYFPMNIRDQQDTVYASASIIKNTTENGFSKTISSEFNFEKGTDEYQTLKALTSKISYHRCFKTLQSEYVIKNNSKRVSLFINNQFVTVLNNNIWIGDNVYCLNYFGTHSLHQDILDLLEESAD